MKLEGKKAIVTGANRSIGAAVAIAFASRGADVAISYRSDEAGAKATVAAIEKLGRKAKAFHADFSQVDGIKAFFDQARDFLGQVDLLVNNAAGYDTSEFLQLKVGDFQHLLQMGVTAPMLLTQLMAEQKIPGSVINISSISGMKPHPNRVAHATVKAALNMLTKATALELAKFNIRVNAIAPGETPYEFTDEVAEHIPLLRKGHAKEQAAAAVFLASDEASWVTGHVMVVDGGQILSS